MSFNYDDAELSFTIKSDFWLKGFQLLQSISVHPAAVIISISVIFANEE